MMFFHWLQTRERVVWKRGWKVRSKVHSNHSSSSCEIRPRNLGIRISVGILLIKVSVYVSIIPVNSEVSSGIRGKPYLVYSSRTRVTDL